MSDGDGNTRYDALCGALSQLAENKVELRIRKAADPCELILHPEVDGPLVILRTGQDSTTVVATSGHDPGGTSEIEDHLTIDLSEAYHWDSVSFESADDLAYHLYKHMVRRRKSVSDLEPAE